MEIVNKRLSDLKPYEKNPRKNDNAVKCVMNSIREFGFKVPLVIDKDNVIVAGHTRYKASKKLGLSEVPCIVADDLTDEQIKAFRLADNKSGELATWDDALLAEELADIGLDMSEFGFDLDKAVNENPYTTNVNIPQYEPKGEDWDASSLYDCAKQDELLSEIENSDVSEDEKAFLREAAHRHCRFNYRHIAEYYAKASPEMQRLMEKSALVIVDVNDAIANGYAKLSKTLKEMKDNEG